MSVPNTTRGASGPWHVTFQDGDTTMGFLTTRPARRIQISTTAPPIRVGGSAAHSAEDFEQFVIDGFEDGGDRELWQSGDKRYAWSDGNVWFGEGRASLDSRWVSEDAGVSLTLPYIRDFNKSPYYIVGANGTKLRVKNTTTSTWADASNGGSAFGASITGLFSNDQYLFIALGASVDAQRWDATSLTTGFTVLTGFKATVFGWYQGILYRGLSNDIYAATANDGSAWGSAIPVGWEGTVIQSLFESNGLLIIGKPEGLFTYDGTLVRMLVPTDVKPSTANWVGSGVWRGATFGPWGTSVYKIAITSASQYTASDSTPKMVGDAAKELYNHGIPKVFIPGPSRLYAGFDDGEGLYPEVLEYNGLGWRQLYRGTSGDTFRAMGYSALDGSLYMNDGATRRKLVNNSGDTPYPDFAASGQWTTPIIDGGWPDEVKAWRSITVITRGLDANNTLQIEYRLNGGAWATIITLNTSPDDPDDPYEILIGGSDIQKSSKRIEFRFTMTGSAAGATTTQVLKFPMIIRALVRTKGVDAYTETCLLDLSGKLENSFGTVGGAGTTASPGAGYTVQQMLEFLNNLRQSVNTVIRTDEWNRRSYVLVKDKSEDPNRVYDATGREQVQVSLRFQDAFVGLTVQDQSTITVSVMDQKQVYAVSGTQGAGIQWAGASTAGEL